MQRERTVVIKISLPKRTSLEQGSKTFYGPNECPVCAMDLQKVNARNRILELSSRGLILHAECPQFLLKLIGFGHSLPLARLCQMKL